MNHYQSQLSSHGFCVFPDVISKKIVTHLREKYLPLLTHKLTLPAHEFFAAEDLSNILFSPTIIEVISQIIGEKFCIYPDFTLRKGMYVPWHTDTPYLSQKQTDTESCANMVQLSIYLQDNTLTNGGGLEVISGSHLYHGINRNNLLSNKIDYSTSIIIPSTAGSMVIWDSRLIHKSREKLESNTAETKLAIQGTISRNELFSAEFLKFLSNRIHAKHKDTIYDQGDRELDYLQSITKLSYPESFNNYQIANINKYGIKLKLV